MRLLSEKECAPASDFAEYTLSLAYGELVSVTSRDPMSMYHMCRVVEDHTMAAREDKTGAVKVAGMERFYSSFDGLAWIMVCHLFRIMTCGWRL